MGATLVTMTGSCALAEAAIMPSNSGMKGARWVPRSPLHHYCLELCGERDRPVRGRIEFSLLAVSRYGFRACDIAAVLCKGRKPVTRWLNQGLCDERDNPRFSKQINRLDAEISSK